MQSFIFYLMLSRPNNWIKNLLLIPGFVFAYALIPGHNTNLFAKFILAVISVCCISSANYIINEWLDRESDKFHPRKKYRRAVVNSLQAKYVYLEYLIFILLGLCTAIFISLSYFIVSLILLLMAIIYNLKPLRTKDIIFLDVITESINTPLRLLLGWFIVTTTTLPSLNFLLAFWLSGAYVMSIKRFAELQIFNNKNDAKNYRRSFNHYSKWNLLVSAIAYAISAGIFWTLFIVDNNPLLLWLLPLYITLFSWYLSISLKPDSIAQHPEYFFKEKKFAAYAIAVSVITMAILFADPSLLKQTSKLWKI